MLRISRPGFPGSFLFFFFAILYHSSSDSAVELFDAIYVRHVFPEIYSENQAQFFLKQ
jgi:hypothetical protein